MMLAQKIAMLLLVWVLGCHMAYAQTVTGKHADNNVTCVACHNESVPVKRAPASTCMACHGDYAAARALTQDVKPNPHDSHQGDLRCTLCHKTHEPSVLYCNECHQFDLQIK